MPKRNLIKTHEFPYHITARSNNREFFPIQMEILWQLIIEKSKHISNNFDAEILAFVLMSNHYHMILKTPRSNIDKIMEYFQREIAKKSNFTTSRINHFFGGPYRWSIINSQQYFYSVVKYVYQNPLRAGLVQKVEDYKFSTVRQFVFSNTPFPSFPLAKEQNNLFFEQYHWDQDKILDWLNSQYSSFENKTIKLSLKKTYAEFSRNPHSGEKRKIHHCFSVD